MKTQGQARVIRLALIMLVASSGAYAQRGNGNNSNGGGNGAGGGPFSTTELYGISIDTDRALAVGVFRRFCEKASCPSTLTALRFGSLTRGTRADVLCADGVCSPLATLTIAPGAAFGLGIEPGVEAGASAGAHAAAELQVSAAVDISLGIELDIARALKIEPAGPDNFQSGGNLLAESGLGSTIYVDHVMVGIKRGSGVTGRISFYGEKEAETTLVAGALGRDGVARCVAEDSMETPCPIGVLGLLELMCADQARCADAQAVSRLGLGPSTPESQRFGALDEEELLELLHEAAAQVALVRSAARDQAMGSRLDNVRETLRELFEDQELVSALREPLKNQLRRSLDDIDELLAIVTSNTRFRETNLETVSQKVEQINSLLADLPDEVIFGVADILPSSGTENLPQPREEGSPVCNVFPRLCR